MVTKLESLSDEIIIQLVDYLDGFQLFKAFYNLNSRFNRILKDFQLSLKLNLKHVRNIDTLDVKMWYAMVNHLTAVTIVGDKLIRLFLSVFTQNDLKGLQSLTLRRVRIDKGERCKNKHEFVE